MQAKAEIIIADDPEGAAQEKAAAQQSKKRTCSNYICCPCCCCLPMWTRYICCILLCIIIVLAIAAGVLASQFKPPSIDMNGVAPDPNGLPAFQRAADLSFTINLGLKFGVNNPNVESLTLASVSTKVKGIIVMSCFFHAYMRQNRHIIQQHPIV